MTRTDYLTQLETYLHKLPEADRIEAMDYFKEHLTMQVQRVKRSSSPVWEHQKKLPMISSLIFSIKRSMKPLLKRMTANCYTLLF